MSTFRQFDKWATQVAARFRHDFRICVDAIERVFSSVSFSTNEVTLLSIESDESEPESDELEFDLGRRGIV